MIMTQSGKTVADSRDPMTQQTQSPKVRGFPSFDLKASLIVVACLLTTAFGKPGSTCNSETQFLVKHGDGSTSCEECPSCPPGQTLSIECGKEILPSTMIICAPCKLGMSFSSKHGTSVCTPCSSCAKDQVVLQNCTLTQDIKCDKRCYGNDRYYDDDKGDCFPCTKCCNDELDVVENECKEKLGTRSSMICSFHSSINRCVKKSTAFPQEPTTTTDQGTITDDYTTQSQSSKHEHTIPATAQPSHRFSQTKAAKHQDLLIPIGVSVALVLALLIIIVAVVLYIRKARKTANYLCCYNCDTETGIPDRGNHHKPTKGNHPGGLDMVEKGLEMTDKVNHHISSTESMEPLLAEGSEQELARSSQQEAKLLSSLLNDALCLQKISEYLDATLAGVNNYRAVAQNYGVDHYKISSVLATHHRGPTTALIEWLAATHTELKVKDFAAVVRQKAKRNDVAILLEAYDSNKN